MKTESIAICYSDQDLQRGSGVMLANRSGAIVLAVTLMAGTAFSPCYSVTPTSAAPLTLKEIRAERQSVRDYLMVPSFQDITGLAHAVVGSKLAQPNIPILATRSKPKGFKPIDVISPAEASAWRKDVSEGEASISQGNLNRAELCFRRALQAATAAACSTKDQAECRNKLANTLALAGKTEEAQSLYKRSLITLERTYGKSSAKIVPTLIALGSFLEAEGDHNSAMALYQRAIAINEKSYGRYSPGVTATVRQSGVQLNSLGAATYAPAARPLNEQAGLQASARLKQSVPAPDDLLIKGDNSNQELLSAFHREIMKTGGDKPVKRRSAWQPELFGPSAMQTE